jgi:uncharacterized protein
MAMTSILWRRLDQPGHDSARLTELASGAVLEGTAVFRESGCPCRLDYRVECDPSWRTVSARVVGWLGAASIDLTLTADPDRRWTLDGRPCPQVLGCDDVDLSFTPATNTLPTRRLRLAMGQRTTVRAAWLDFPSVRLAPLEQIYERVAESRYRYESAGGFTALLETNTSGFVTHYPGLWQSE